MYVSLLDFNPHFNKIDRLKQNNTINNSNPLKPLAIDCVQFTGSKKELTNEEDNAFVYVISQDLGLDEQKTAQLKGIVYDFIKKHELNSMGDINREDNYELQTDLKDIICQELSVPEELTGFVDDEIQCRCRDGEKYIPVGLRRFNFSVEISDMYDEGDADIADPKFNSILEDDILYFHLKKLLRMSPVKAYQLREFIEKYMEENNLGSIETFFKNENKIDEQKRVENQDIPEEIYDLDELDEQEEFYTKDPIERLKMFMELEGKKRKNPNKHEQLMNEIKKRFSFSEFEMDLLCREFEERASVHSLYGIYTPANSIYSKDLPIYQKVINDGKYNHRIDDMDFSYCLCTLIKNEAEMLGCKTLFDLFKLKDFKQSDAYKFISVSKLSESQQADLIMELRKVANNYDKYEQQIPKNPSNDIYIAFARISQMKEKIVKKFGIKENKYTDLDLLEILRRMFPENMDGEDLDPDAAAFLIYDKYHLPSGSYGIIKRIINKVNNLSEEEVDKRFQKNYS